ncbi:MAG: hypothetical protein C4K58_07715 [Flavobacteriaceae bacterium]|nr:MAG: hypothetical protein C4K58_07715 [Flavobacteriaceae bacterium]
MHRLLKFKSGLSKILFGSLFLISSFIYGQETQLKILSWNLYFLPKAADLSTQIQASYRKDRASEIKDFILKNNYDVLVLQELFHDGSRKSLQEGLKEIYPYQYGPANHQTLEFVNHSGVMIFSKTPLTQLGVIRYENCTKVDCLVKKGALLLEGEKEGKKFQILGTHLDSGMEKPITNSQLEQIRILLDQNQTSGIAQLICGDLNLNKDDENWYESLLQITNSEDSNPHLKDFSPTIVDGNLHIDYVLIRKNQSQIEPLSHQISAPKSENPKLQKGRNKALKDHLSDHKAIEVILTL